MAISCLCISTNLTVTPSPKFPNSKHIKNPLNSTLKSLSKSGKLDEALHLLLQPQQSSLDSYATFLHSCISTKSVHHGRKLYLHLLQSKDTENFLKNPTLKSKFVTLFSACGQLDEARRAYGYGIDEMGYVPESVFVAMAIGFSKNGKTREALLVYCEMLARSVEPGNFAFSVALKACSETLESRIGKGVHAQIVKSHEEPDQVVYNALLKYYSDIGSFEDALKVFDKMPDRNIATWNALVAGLVKKEQVFEAFETFRKMQMENVSFSWVGLTTILAVCAHLTALHIGKEVHGQILKSEEFPDILVINSLLDMYAKSGEMEYCRKVFNAMQTKDLTSWNTVINGYAINGSMEEAMAIFNKMVEAGFMPDEVTFISLLSGCSHTGMVSEGQIIYEKMKSEFGINPSLEHYACVTDMLGRAGKIEEALDLVKKMPFNPSGSIWGSLLNSCRLHNYVSLAEIIAKQLFKIEPTNPGNYIMLSNIYANAKMWDKVKYVRELMETRGIKKEAGCSWVRIKDRIYSFVASGGFEFRNSDEFKRKWDELSLKIEKNGYKTDTRVVLHDTNEEMKLEWICGHSERLAMVFALINSGSGLPIRITKNLRVCADCHSWMKYVSEVSRRKIVVRDTNRFHHFEKGDCSCRDYW